MANIAHICLIFWGDSWSPLPFSLCRAPVCLGCSSHKTFVRGYNWRRPDANQRLALAISKASFIVTRQCLLRGWSGLKVVMRTCLACLFCSKNAWYGCECKWAIGSFVSPRSTQHHNREWWWFGDCFHRARRDKPLSDGRHIKFVAADVCRRSGSQETTVCCEQCARSSKCKQWQNAFCAEWTDSVAKSPRAWHWTRVFFLQTARSRTSCANRPARSGDNYCWCLWRERCAPLRSQMLGLLQSTTL